MKMIGRIKKLADRLEPRYGQGIREEWYFYRLMRKLARV